MLVRLLLLTALIAPCRAADPLAWPPATRESRPWSYWWWMGSAVDPANLTRELQRFRDAGWGGVHIIPIYGAKGYEDRYIEYLSPKWMDVLRHTVSEANRLDLGVDMTTGTGWCFGGPNVSGTDACTVVVPKLGPQIQTAQCRQGVKRAAPGGEGPMLDPYSGEAIRNYLAHFTKAFDSYTGPKPRSMYHDSFEYQANWSAGLPAEFERRRGYRIQDELPALLGNQADDRAARVKSDYRETLSDLMVEGFLAGWVEWSHGHGFLTRNEAHGSPGNLLDLYAGADIPETEMFNRDRGTLVAKFASSAAHVAGRRLVASETGTWLKEHFTERLADLKDLVDQLFVAGVNHVFYHGSCYSPGEAPWPGWLFYASTEMNSRNSFWHDVPVLNAYIARVQSVLQSGRPGNDVLLYWPIYDLWHNPKGLNINMTVHSRGWFEDQPVAKAAHRLWDLGFTFDFVSDRQLLAAKAESGGVRVPGGMYRIIVVPKCERMPVETFEKLASLARAGAKVIFEDTLPSDVPGLAKLEERRARLGAARKSIRAVVGDIEAMLEKAGVARETMADRRGLEFIRRADEGGRFYFIDNRGSEPIDGWVPLAGRPAAAVLMDAMTGRTGIGALRGSEVFLQLQPGESIIVRVLRRKVQGKPWKYMRPSGESVEIRGTWEVKFVSGGPVLPEPYRTEQLLSWTSRGGELERFAGTALYRVTFDAPAGGPWLLDLGDVRESARVRLNGKELGAAILPPYRVPIDALRPKGNVLEVEVTNLSANRIRDLDRRKVVWRTFRDINFVNIDYKPFDASGWPLRESGLLGPVRLLRWSTLQRATAALLPPRRLKSPLHVKTCSTFPTPRASLLLLAGLRASP